MNEFTPRELRKHVRGEALPPETVVVVRGGPARLPRLAAHAERTHETYVLDGKPVWGISVFGALDDIGPASLNGILQRMSSYRVVHLPTVGQLLRDGFNLLPTFARPHFTVLLRDGGEPELARLSRALGTEQSNRYHWVERR